MAQIKIKTRLDRLTRQELHELSLEFCQAKPFNYIVLDNFLDESDALSIASEFPKFDDPLWYSYDNPLEIKKASNNWNAFQNKTYQFFNHVLSPEFTEKVELLINGKMENLLVPDIGLHGGGLHTHKSGGKLNPHLDYSIHPKLGLQRTANLILYINPEWKPEYGGAFGIWENKEGTIEPGKLERQIDCIFNRAVIFNTTQNSWHGICNQIISPEKITRNSLAAYYLMEPPALHDSRMKVRYAPTEEQKGDPIIENLIKDRQSITKFSKVYVKEKSKI